MTHSIVVSFISYLRTHTFQFVINDPYSLTYQANNIHSSLFYSILYIKVTDSMSKILPWCPITPKSLLFKTTKLYDYDLGLTIALFQVILMDVHTGQWNSDFINTFQG
jgi:hypothetical protein